MRAFRKIVVVPPGQERSARTASVEDILYINNRGIKSFMCRDILEVIAARASVPSERPLLSDDVMCEGSESDVQARLEHLYDLVEATDNEKIERFLAQYY